MQRLANRHVVVTQAGDFMGPAVCELFTAEGALVTADKSDLTRPDAAKDLITRAGHIDVLVVNLMERNRRHSKNASSSSSRGTSPNRSRRASASPRKHGRRLMPRPSLTAAYL